MTTETTMKCADCGHVATLVVWKLGHKESDMVLCPKCKEVLVEWKKSLFHIFEK
jgi:hypothetical protein